MTKNNYTEHIGRRAVTNILHGFDFAQNTGNPINVYVVLHLREQLGATVTTQFTKIRRKYRNWNNYYHKKVGGFPLPPIYAYIFEAPTDASHVNWPLHIPEHMIDEFEAKLPKWVEKVTGDFQKFDIKVQRITAGSEKRVANYCSKGVDPQFVKHFHLEQIAKPQGRIYGRRVAVSPAISKAARDNVGFKAKHHRNSHKRGMQWPLGVS